MKKLTGLTFGAFFISGVIGSLPAYSEVATEDLLVASESVDEETLAKSSQSRLLPFWGDDARKLGYELPEPFGININYMNMRQNIQVQNIAFSGLYLWNTPLPSNLVKIKIDRTRQRSTTKLLKLDAWLFPFLNTYAVFGETKGRTLSNIASVSLMTRIKNVPFELKFKGKTYGAGAVLAGGYKDIFGLVDTNYTYTSFDILDGQIKAFTVSPRLGYSFHVPAIATRSNDSKNLKVWVGGMYQNVQQDFRGSLNDLTMPPELKVLMNNFNKKGLGRFEVKQRLESPWNMLVGAQYEITPHFNLLSEIGFNERNSFFVAGEFRF